MKQLPYAEQLKDPAHGDLTIRLNNQTNFHVHRFLLELSSPVFAAMLTNGMRETSSATVEIVEEDSNHSLAFGQMLSYFYPFCRVVVDDDNALALLHFADKYQLPPKLKEDCECHLTRQPRSWELLLTAQQYGLDRLLELHVRWAASQVSVFRGLQQMDQLKKATLKKILTRTADIAHQFNISLNVSTWTTARQCAEGQWNKLQ
jgi:hypothetical protein